MISKLINLFCYNANYHEELACQYKKSFSKTMS